jgi:hypothetical protein
MEVLRLDFLEAHAKASVWIVLRLCCFIEYDNSGRRCCRNMGRWVIPRGEISQEKVMYSRRRPMYVWRVGIECTGIDFGESV